MWTSVSFFIFTVRLYQVNIQGKYSLHYIFNFSGIVLIILKLNASLFQAVFNVIEFIELLLYLYLCIYEEIASLLFLLNPYIFFAGCCTFLKRISGPCQSEHRQTHKTTQTHTNQPTIFLQNTSSGPGDTQSFLSLFFIYSSIMQGRGWVWRCRC